MEAQEQLAKLKMLVDSTPDLRSESSPFSTDTHIWLGRLNAVVADQGTISDVALLKAAIGKLSGPYLRGKDEAANEILGVLYRAIAQAELNSPAGSTGSFVAVGNTFDALQAISKLLAEITKDVLIVDPYMDDTILTRYAVLAPESVTVRLLSDEKTVKPGLAAAAAAWRSQYAASRELLVRLAPAKSLHDRLIIADSTSAWVLTQSFKDLAARSPASLTLSDSETSTLKVDAYEALWAKSSAI